MPFEIFTNKHRSPAGASVVITDRGLLSLSSAALDLLGRPAHAELLFDEDRRCVGIRAAAAESANSYAIRGGRTISATAFVKHHRIENSTSRRFPATLSAGILCLDLNGESQRVTSNRRKRQAIESPTS